MTDQTINIQLRKEEVMTNTIDSKNTEFRQKIKDLYQKLQIVPSPDNFQCLYFQECSKESLQRKMPFYTGNWAYVGADYGKACIGNKEVGILFVAMDIGGWDISSRTFPDTQKAFREACVNHKNPHMGGVSSIMRFLVNDKEPDVYSNQFALTNSLKCVEGTCKASTKPSKEMEKNCLNHLSEEIKTLDPDIIITQGVYPSDSVKRILGLTSPTYTFSWKGRRDIQLFEEENNGKQRFIIIAPHPARAPGWKWSKNSLPENNLPDPLKNCLIKVKSLI